MTNVIDFRNFRKSNIIETTDNIIKEEANMNTIQTVGTIGRQSTFENIGTKIVNSSTVEEALIEAGLNYEVHKIETNNLIPLMGLISGKTTHLQKKDINDWYKNRYKNILYDEMGFAYSLTPIKDHYSTCLTFDGGKTYGEAFGIVSDKYQVIQNNEAFSFIDCIPELEFKKMGTTKGGMIYFIGELPELNILGDSYNPYLIFRNSHNGRYNLQVTICPLRIVCQNQFNIAFKESPNTITIRHSRQAPERIEQARRVITAHGEYYKTLQVQAEEWATQHIGAFSVQQVIEDLFPIKEDMKEFQKERMEESRALFNKALNSNDNQNFKNSVWGMINAYSDYITHREPARQTSTAAENRFMSVTFDPALMNNFIQLVQSKIAA